MWDFGQDARPAIWRVEWLSGTLERLGCFTPWFATSELAESVPVPSKPDGGAYLVLTKLERDYLVISKIIARAGQFPVVKTGDTESPAPKKRGRPKATPPHKHHFVSSGGDPARCVMPVPGGQGCQEPPPKPAPTLRIELETEAGTLPYTGGER